jgi:hypothetical protein
VLAYPVASYLTQSHVPLPVRLTWVVLAAGALARSGPSLLLFVAVSPLLPIVPALAGWPAVSLLEQWLLALLVAAWLRHAQRPAPPALPPLVTLLLVMVSASLVVALAPLTVEDGGVRQFVASLHGFLRNEFITTLGLRHMFAPVVAWAVVAEGIGFGWLLFRHLGEEGEQGQRNLAIAALTGGALVSAWAVWQWWTRAYLIAQWTVFDPYITRVNASFTDVNTLGSYLASLIPVFAGLACAAKSWRPRLAWSAGGVLACGAAVFTGSRAAWFGIVVGALAFAALAWRFRVWQATPERRAQVRRFVLGAALVTFAATGALSAYATLADVRHRTQRSYVDAVLYTLNVRIPLDERLKGRVELWRAAVSMVKAAPTAGIGIGRFYRDVSRYAPSPDQLVRIQENAHNYALQLAAECGLPTFLVWIAAIGWLMRRGYRGARSTDSRAVRIFVAAAAGGILAFLATCLTGHPLLLREGQYAFWVVLALAAGLPATAGTSRARNRWLLAAALVVVGLTPIHVRAELLGIDWTRRALGVYEEEQDDGGAYRWTRGAATFYVPQGAVALSLQVRSVAPTPQRLTVRLDGRALDRIELWDHDWRRLTYLLPRNAPDGRFHEMILQTAPTWTPAHDPRELGVMVRALEWRP